MEKAQISGMHVLSMQMTANSAMLSTMGYGGAHGSSALAARAATSIATAARGGYLATQAVVTDVVTFGPVGAYMLNGQGINTAALLSADIAIGLSGTVSPTSNLPVLGMRQLGSEVRLLGNAATNVGLRQLESEVRVLGKVEGAVALQSRTGMLTGVPEFDQLFSNSPKAGKMLDALARRGVNVVDDASRLDPGVAAQVFYENGQLTLVYDSNGTTFVDMLHDARHVAQVQRVEAANVLGDKDIFGSQRLLGAAERGAYEYETRLGAAKGFSDDYMSYLQKQINEYYPVGYSKKFNASPTLGAIFNAMEPGLKP